MLTIAQVMELKRLVIFKSDYPVSKKIIMKCVVVVLIEKKVIAHEENTIFTSKTVSSDAQKSG